MGANFLRLVLALLAVCLLVSTVAGQEKFAERAARKGYNARLKKKNPEASPQYLKRATPTAAPPVSVSAPTATPPPSCGGNNCANAFNKQFTASLDNLSDFCGAFTDGKNTLAATGTASWAKNCIGTSTDSAAIASKVSSACSCFVPEPTHLHGDGVDNFRFLTKNTEPFRVKSLPEVDSDVGEMYSGLIPIDTNDTSRALFFVFQPTVGAPVDEVTIWLNGGPGCSSLEGFFQENGRFIWSWGMYQPQVNPYSWVNLTNVLWVEQPVGTGFSIGEVRATSEEEIAEDFAKFFRNFQRTFGISKFKIYLTGESYAGRYVPYISANFLDKKDKRHFDLSGALMYDPVIGSYDYIQEQVVAYPFLEENNNMIGLNKSYVAKLKGLHQSCGYDDYIKTYLTYPASKIQPVAPDYPEECGINSLIELAAFHPNPCFNSYEINTQCPMPSDPLGFPTDLASSYPLLTPLYFDRDDVKKAMHAPTSINWQECSGPVFVNSLDNSLDPIQKVLPKVIEATQRVLVANGALDMVIITDGTLLAIQNMTWGGKLGFQNKPEKEIVINLPDLQYAQVYADNGIPGFEDPQGTMGVQHFERGLMFAETYLSGHMVPQFQPRSAYRHLQWVLGRIQEL